jgi:hypothetical protein
MGCGKTGKVSVNTPSDIKEVMHTKHGNKIFLNKSNFIAQKNEAIQKYYKIGSLIGKGKQLHRRLRGSQEMRRPGQLYGQGCQNHEQKGYGTRTANHDAQRNQHSKKTGNSLPRITPTYLSSSKSSKTQTNIILSLNSALAGNFLKKSPSL